MIWLTTVGRDGAPQPNPVWFLWDSEDGVLTYNRADAVRLENIQRHPRVSLNFDGDGHGGDIIVLIGDAEVSSEHPPAHRDHAYLAKYRESMRRVSGSVESFAEMFSVPVYLRLNRVRGH